MMKKADRESVKISSIIGEGTVIEGDYSAKGAVRMDGCINGNVQVTGVLIMGAAGKITGDVTAAGAVIGGELIGNLDAENKVELTGSAKVIGDIRTNAIVIDENAVFQGRCDMNQEVPAGSGRRNAKAVREGRKSAKEAIQEALKEAEAEEETDGAEDNQEISLEQYIEN